MTRDELRKIKFPCKAYNAEEALFSEEQVLDAMEAAYNKAIEDVLDKSYLSDETDLEGHLIRVVSEEDIERLRI